MEDHSLIDNDLKPGDGKQVFYTAAAKILLLAGLAYGAYLFFTYFRIKQNINPLLPDYAAMYIYGDAALKGGLLLSSLFICQVLILFRRYAIVFYILMLTYAFLLSGVYLLFIPLNKG